MRLEPVGVAGDPVHQIPAIRSAGGRHLRLVDVAVGDQDVGGRHHVGERLVGVRAEDRLDPRLAEARRAVEVHHRHHVAGRGKRVRMPAEAEGVAEGADGPAVDQLHQRVLPGLVESRREHHEHLDGVAAGALEGHLLHGADRRSRHQLLVDRREVAEARAIRLHHRQLRRRIDGVALEDDIARARDFHAGQRAAAMQLAWRAALQRRSHTG